MGSVLVDNSTLSAVERLCGLASVPRAYDLQGDFSAYEQFLQALLFYDRFSLIPDYIEEHQPERLKNFSYVSPIDLTRFDYSGAEKLADGLIDDIILRIQSGTIERNEIGRFLENIGLYLTAAWHMTSSEWFLTLKVLSEDGGDELRYKYSPLYAAIWHEASDREALDGLSLSVNRNGRNEDLEAIIGKDHHVGWELRAFASCLNWLAKRVAFYTIISSAFDHAICFHPIRHNFALNLLPKTEFELGDPLSRAEIHRSLSARSQVAVRQINAALDPHRYACSVPLFSQWAVLKAGSPKRGVDFVMNQRDTKEFANVRRYLGEIEDLHNEGERVEKLRLVHELRNAMQHELDKFCSKFDLNPAQSGSIGVTFSVPLGIAFDPRALLKVISAHSRRRKFSSLFRNIVQDILSFDQLGDARSLMLRDRRTDNSRTSTILRVENARFRKHSSSWKRPMDDI